MEKLQFVYSDSGGIIYISTVAIYSNEDKSSLHRYKADESYLVGSDLGPAKVI